VIVLDTNVFSETLRPAPADSLSRWTKAQPSTSLFTTTIGESEIFYGLALMPGVADAFCWMRLWRRFSRKISRSEFCRLTAPRREHSLRSRRDDGDWYARLASSILRLRPLPIRAGLLSQRAMLRTSPTAGLGRSARGSRRLARRSDSCRCDTWRFRDYLATGLC
jgi:predicted nucleic acid-binding protein